MGGEIIYDDRLVFGVIQKPIYLPNMRRVWASRAGIAPNMMKFTGNSSHCRTIQAHLNLPYCGGLGGRRTVEIMAEVTKPNIERYIIKLVILGRL